MAKQPRKIYSFGDFEFSSLKKAQEFLGTIRQGVEDGDTITIPAHAIAVEELFAGHVEHADKPKCGVKRFFVAPAPNHPNSRCFWIERTDGSETDFGFAACVASVGWLNRQSFRALVRPQIYAFKAERMAKNADVFVSDYSGMTFPVSEAHVDHQPEFEEILARFAKAEGVDLEKELLTRACDARSEPVWKDETLAVRFLEFHSTFPLRLVSILENLSLLRRKKSHEN